jgi:hypothetical protein
MKMKSTYLTPALSHRSATCPKPQHIALLPRLEIEVKPPFRVFRVFRGSKLSYRCPSVSAFPLFRFPLFSRVFRGQNLLHARSKSCSFLFLVIAGHVWSRLVIFSPVLPSNQNRKTALPPNFKTGSKKCQSLLTSAATK